eukprot:611107-Prorocentrum_minimum.AAC.3
MCDISPTGGDIGAASNTQETVSWGSTQGDPVCSALSLPEGQATLTQVFRGVKRNRGNDVSAKRSASHVEWLGDDDVFDEYSCTPPQLPQPLEQGLQQRSDSFGRGIPVIVSPVTPVENDEAWCKRISLDPGEFAILPFRVLPARQ